MRPISVKYEGDCRRCGATLAVGSEAVYEKRIGIFCPGCAPTDPEEIREYRQEAADRKAERLDGWAEKREQRAAAQLNSLRELRSCHAFNTQPGHIPARARMIAADDRAHESLNKAREMRARAASLRRVRVKGDAERTREAKREKTRAWIKKGQKVTCGLYGISTVIRVNKKTATIETPSGFRATADLSWLILVEE